ncbi:vacuolar protein sorting-associated protein 33B-like isoform X2 [Watersipora subatra]
MKPIDRLADISFLKNHGVDRIFKMDSSKPVQGSKERFYIMRPKAFNARLLVEQIKGEQTAGHDRRYTVVMVPRSLYICEKIFEEHGLHGCVHTEALPLHTIPIDNDIITMELDLFYSSYFLHHDETWVHAAASALVSLQQEFGKLQNVYAIGQCAKNTWDLSQTLLEYEPDITGLQSQIEHLIIMDRDVDLVTPLCSQVTYEGLLDDIFGIQCGVIEFGKEVTQSEKSVKSVLSSNDSLFEEVRNRHFSTVYKLLSTKARELQKNYGNVDSMSVSQLKSFVADDLQSLKQLHRSLTLHISACEVITKKKTAEGDLAELLATEHGLLQGHGMTENMKYIEELIHRQQNPVNLLRLLCLLSLVKDGLSPDTYDSLKTLFLHSHGYQHILTFHNLAKLGLFTKRLPPQQATVKLPGTSGSSIKLSAAKINLPKKSSFQMLSKNLQLIRKPGKEDDLRNPTDMAYVFSGAYTPLSCRLVELILQKRGFSGLEDSIKLTTNTYYQSTRAQSARGSKIQEMNTSGASKDQTVLVFFLGGVTYSEIAALRFLGQTTGNRFLILTTNILTGNRFISQLKTV